MKCMKIISLCKDFIQLELRDWIQPVESFKLLSAKTGHTINLIIS